MELERELIYFRRLMKQMEELDKLKDIFSTPKNVVVVTHRNPDGDAIGSSLAIRLYLEKGYHTCEVILPSEYPAVFEFLPSIKSVHVLDNDHNEVISILERAEIIFCLDFNSLERVEKMAEAIEASRAYKILIDHHLDPEPFADYYLSDPLASSTCELVYKFIKSLGDVGKIDIEMATCLFTGIITDTGSFSYGTNPDVYQICSELKSIGVDDYAVHDAIFNCWTERQMNILGHALRNRLEILKDLGAGIIYLTKEDYQKYKISRGDTEGLVNYILMIKGINVAAFIRELPGVEVRISLRSKGDISVQELARDHFNGGGHKNASGGSSDLDLKKTVKKFKEVVSQYV